MFFLYCRNIGCFDRQRKSGVVYWKYKTDNSLNKRGDFMNEILESVQYRSNKIHWLFRCIIYGVLFFIINILIFVPVYLIAVVISDGGVINSFFFEQFLNVILIHIISFALILIFEKSKLWPRLGFEKGNILKKYSEGFFIGIILICVSALPIILFFTEQISIAKPVEWISIFIFLIFFLIQGAAEEVMVRGVFFPIIVKESRPITALILTSLFFGILHIFNPNFTIVGFINITLVGVLFGYFVLYYDSIWQACALHSAWNFVQGNILGFEVSGMGLTSILEVEVKGNELLTGGMFGVEGSVFCSIVLLVSLVIYHRKCEKKGINIFIKTKKEDIEEL